MGARNRAGVKRRIAEVADAALSEYRVTVTYGSPGDSISDSSLFFGPVEGESSPESLGYGDVLTEDRFTVPAFLAVTPYLDAAEAEEGVEAVLRAFELVLNSLHRLKDRTGVIDDGDPATYDGVRSVRIGQAQGPYTAAANSTQNAPIVGLYGFDIDCVSDL